LSVFIYFCKLETTLKFNILHISDLHRDTTSPLTNVALISSLRTDFRQLKATEEFESWDLIIVSGDIVQGVTYDEEDADKKLHTQYEEAEGLLDDLCNEYLEGNRERIIIVPGNHDVNFARMYDALEEIELETVEVADRKGLAAGLFAENSTYRWDWSTFKLYQIKDADKYNARFNEFIEFYNRFYQGKRTYSANASDQYDIFDFPELNLVITGFNSCYQNDPWRKQAAINPECLSQCVTSLTDIRYHGKIRAAVWHHSTNGGPEEIDYLDDDILQQLIAYEFSLGFHGHQHKSELINQEYAFGGEQKINVLSSGTLCGGAYALPTGRSRGYNRVALNTETYTGTLFSRKMMNSNFRNPLWGEETPPTEFEFQAPPPIDHAMISRQKLMKAEELYSQGEIDMSVSVLKEMDETDLSRALLFKIVNSEDKFDSNDIVALFSPPENPIEAISVLAALRDLGDKETISEILRLDVVVNSDDPVLLSLTEKLTGASK